MDVFLCEDLIRGHEPGQGERAPCFQLMGVRLCRFGLRNDVIWRTALFLHNCLIFATWQTNLKQKLLELLCLKDSIIEERSVLVRYVNTLGSMLNKGLL